MKNKFAKFASLLLGGILALSLCACGGGKNDDLGDDDPPIVNGGDDDTKEPSGGDDGGNKNPPADTTPTAADVVSAIQATFNAAEQNYDFTLDLAGNVTLGAITTPDAHATYTCNYRYNSTSKDLKFKRVTSGALLYDATEYIYSSGENRVTVKYDDKGTLKKVAVEGGQDAEGELHLINLPFVALMKSLSASEIGSIQKSGTGYKATLTLSANNTALNAVLGYLVGMDTTLNFKGVSFSNLANGLGFEFALSGSTLSSFSLKADLSVPVASATTAITLTYSHKASSTAVTPPRVSGLILDRSGLTSEITKINDALSAVENMPTYSLDLTAVNEMDPGWNVMATTDSYFSRLYKHTDEKDFTHFNNSFKYKTHTDEGKETYKYTIGNVTNDDAEVYLIDRKGNNTATALQETSQETLASRFAFLTSIFEVKDAQTDCIRKVTEGGVTTYSVYLKDSAVAALSKGIVGLINSCPAEGVIFVDNLMGSDFTVENASYKIVMKGDTLVSMQLETEIKYNPVSGEYMENNVTLNNTLTLLVNDEENFAEAQKYTAAEKGKKFLGIGDDLAGSGYFIL